MPSFPKVPITTYRLLWTAHYLLHLRFYPTQLRVNYSYVSIPPLCNSTNRLYTTCPHYTPNNFHSIVLKPTLSSIFPTLILSIFLTAPSLLFLLWTFQKKNLDLFLKFLFKIPKLISFVVVVFFFVNNSFTDCNSIKSIRIKKQFYNKTERKKEFQIYQGLLSIYYMF